MKSVRFIEDTGELVEIGKGECIRFGAWEGAFDCTVTRNGEQLELVMPAEFVPDWPLFGLDSDRTFLHRPATGEEAVEIWSGDGPLKDMVVAWDNPFREGNGADALSAFLKTIPESVRSVAAPFGEAQWFIMEAVHDGGSHLVSHIRQELREHGPNWLFAFVAERFIRWREKADRAQIVRDFFSLPEKDRLDSHLARLIDCTQLELPNFNDYEVLVSLAYSARAFDEVCAAGRIGEPAIMWVRRAKECCVREVLQIVEEEARKDDGRAFPANNRVLLEHFARDMTAAYYPWQLRGLMRSVKSYEQLWSKYKEAPSSRTNYGSILVDNSFLY